MARDKKTEKLIADYRVEQLKKQDPEQEIADWNDLSDASQQVWRARYRTGWSFNEK